jgi:hypothetical protein
MNIFARLDLPVLVEADVLVAGAGSAGCVAAIAAAEKSGGKVVLLERYGFAGGTSTQMLDTFYGFFTPGEEARKVVGGLPDRVVNALDAAGAVFLRPNTYGAGTGVNYDPERLKLVWDRLLLSAGVQVLLHTTVVGVDTSPDRRIDSVVVWTKGGFFRIRARTFIDASGDADLCVLAGFDFEKAGELEPAQTLTTTFRMCQVNLELFAKAGGKKMLTEKMTEAVEHGRHPLPRKKGSVHAMVQPGCISTVAVRVASRNPTNALELTVAEMEGRRQAYVFEKFLRSEVPGFSEAAIIGLSTQIGIRETRRVYGEYRLTEQDCLTLARFDDRVFLCGAPVEDHRLGVDGEEETVWKYLPGNGVYDVPYRTLVPKGSRNLWVVGRCFSATHVAHASCRSMAQTMAMGQAAGFAAALALRGDCPPKAVPIPALQQQLMDSGAILQAPQKVAFTGRNDWKLNSESP